MAKLECPCCGAVLEADLKLLEAPKAHQLARRSARRRFMLTESQARTVDLAVDGMSNAEIAKQLGIKVQVVKNYMHQAFLKIGCEHRTEMIGMVLLGTDSPR